MCNDYKLKRAYQEIADRLKQLQLPLSGAAPIRTANSSQKRRRALACADAISRAYRRCRRT